MGTSCGLRARTYGVPVVPSAAVYSVPPSSAIASTSKSSGQVWNASCTEQPQSDSIESVSSSSAGCVAVMWMSAKHGTPVTVKPPGRKTSSSGTGV